MLDRLLAKGPGSHRRELVNTTVSHILESADVSRFLKARPAYGAALHQQVQRWGQQLETSLKHQTLPASDQRELSLLQECQQQDETEFCDNLDALLLQLRSHSNFYQQARELLAQREQMEPSRLREEFLRRWQQNLEIALLAQQLELVEQEREKLFSDLNQRMETCDQLDEVLAEADPKRMGRLWDMAATRLHQQQVRHLNKFSRALRKNRGLKEIADQLGRMARQTMQHKEQRYQVRIPRRFQTPSPDVMDDIVGIHLKDDLNRMLSSESLYLAYPELELIFYKHLVEQRLLNYQLSGVRSERRQVEETRRRSSSQQQEPGPFLVCVDTSGSMGGFPELCAKALCLGLMQHAMSEQRGCYVVIFSTDIVCFELGAQQGLNEALDFLSYSFSGGTDLQPCIQHAVEMMREGDYASADLVVISDFIAQRLPADLVAEVEHLKEHRNRFHAVSLSRYGNPALMQIFDHLWSFDTSLFGRVLTKIR